MSVRPIATIACAVAVLLQAGCAGRATRPVVTQVEVSLAATPAEGGPAQPVVAEAQVLNAGGTRVWHCQGCGCGNGIGITVLGPDGAAVALSDPNAPVPACADRPVPLEPGRALTHRVVFTGTLFTIGHPGYPSPTYPAPAGAYTVVARFSYSLREFDSAVPMERTTTFRWVP